MLLPQSDLAKKMYIVRGRGRIIWMTVISKIAIIAPEVIWEDGITLPSTLYLQEAQQYLQSVYLRIQARHTDWMPGFSTWGLHNVFTSRFEPLGRIFEYRESLGWTDARPATDGSAREFK